TSAYQSSCVSLLPIYRQESNSKNQNHRDRKHYFPAQIHELIDAQPGQRPAQPDLHEYQKERLEREQNRPGDELRNQRRRQNLRPTSEKNRRGYAGNYEHVRILRQHEEREAHPGVLRVVAGNQLRLGLGNIERSSIYFGQRAHEIDEECHKGERVTKDEPLLEASL